jgi:molybdate transport system ATP-binding protein
MPNHGPPVLDLDIRYSRGSFTLHARAQLESGVTGICGPSGAGKSTLLALLVGLLKPQSGRLRLNGETLVDVQAAICVPAWRRHIGMVFQDGLLFPHRSVRDNLLYGWQRLKPQERRLDYATVVDLLEIGPLHARRPAQLSGGERQRVALGRALLYSPQLLLLDEPLSSLDDRLKQQILPFLRRVRDETQIPMIYVSHARAELDYLADRVLDMRDGRLVDCDSRLGSGARAHPALLARREKEA